MNESATRSVLVLVWLVCLGCVGKKALPGEFCLSFGFMRLSVMNYESATGSVLVLVWLVLVCLPGKIWSWSACLGKCLLRFLGTGPGLPAGENPVCLPGKIRSACLGKSGLPAWENACLGFSALS